MDKNNYNEIDDIVDKILRKDETLYTTNNNNNNNNNYVDELKFDYKNLKQYLLPLKEETAKSPNKNNNNSNNNNRNNEDEDEDEDDIDLIVQQIIKGEKVTTKTNNNTTSARAAPTTSFNPHYDNNDKNNYDYNYHNNNSGSESKKYVSKYSNTNNNNNNNNKNNSVAPYAANLTGITIPTTSSSTTPSRLRNLNNNNSNSNNGNGNNYFNNNNKSKSEDIQLQLQRFELWQEKKEAKRIQQLYETLLAEEAACTFEPRVNDIHRNKTSAMQSNNDCTKESSYGGRSNSRGGHKNVTHNHNSINGFEDFVDRLKKGKAERELPAKTDEEKLNRLRDFNTFKNQNTKFEPFFLTPPKFKDPNSNVTINSTYQHSPSKSATRGATTSTALNNTTSPSASRKKNNKNSTSTSASVSKKKEAGSKMKTQNGEGDDGARREGFLSRSLSSSILFAECFDHPDSAFQALPNHNNNNNNGTDANPPPNTFVHEGAALRQRLLFSDEMTRKLNKLTSRMNHELEEEELALQEEEVEKNKDGEKDDECCVIPPMGAFSITKDKNNNKNNNVSDDEPKTQKPSASELLNAL